MTSSELKKLIEKGLNKSLGKKGLGAVNMSTEDFNRLKPFLESQLKIELGRDCTHGNTYIGLLRECNDKLKEKEPSANSPILQDNGNDMNSVVTFHKSHGSSVLPVTLRVEKKLNKLTNKIQKDNEKLKNELDEIQNAEPEIDIQRHFWGGLNKKSIEKALSCVHSSLCDYFITCGDAIRSSNKSISNVLDLIKLLTMAEVDIYHFVDDIAIKEEELSHVVKDWCKEHGINDENVNQLLETSFKRAYTLRDRINGLRTEFYNKFEYDNERINSLFSSLTEYQKEIRQATDSALGDIETSENKVIDSIDLHTKEKKDELQNLYNKFSSEAQNEIKQINNLKESIDKKKEEFKENFDSYIKEIKEKEGDIENKSKEIIEDIDKKHTMQIGTLNAIISENQDAVRQYRKYIVAFGIISTISLILSVIHFFI